MVGSLKHLSAGKAVLVVLKSQPQGFFHHLLAKNILNFFFLAQNSVLSKYVAILGGGRKRALFSPNSLNLIKFSREKSNATLCSNLLIMINVIMYQCYVKIKNNLTIARGEGGGDSGEKGFQELLQRTQGQNQRGG